MPKLTPEQDARLDAAEAALAAAEREYDKIRFRGSRVGLSALAQDDSTQRWKVQILRERYNALARSYGVRGY